MKDGFRKKSEGKHQQLRQISLCYLSGPACFSFYFSSFHLFIYFCLFLLFELFYLFSLSYCILIFLLSLHSTHIPNNTLLLVFYFLFFLFKLYISNHIYCYSSSHTAPFPGLNPFCHLLVLYHTCS